MIDKLKELNAKLIDHNANNPDELNKQELIKRILDVKNCFFKIDMEHSYAILRDLGFAEEELKRVYLELVDIKNM